MKTKIKNLISTIEKNEGHHCEVFSLENKEKIRVSVNEKHSYYDGRGWYHEIDQAPLLQLTKITYRTADEVMRSKEKN